MRKLVILRGAMGCGKSTFIKENNLERFTLSSDQIRLMFNSPQINCDYSEEIPQFNNKKVWNLLFKILEERMKKGEFTIIDAVHAYNDESFPVYKKLAEKYRYRLYILDFSDIPKEEVYKRNLSREKFKIVPTESIDRIYKVFSKEKIPSSFKLIKYENFNEIINVKPRSLDKYDNIHVIGDIHGCYSVLQQYLKENPLNENDGYIFVGDYFDRGTENYETFILLKNLSEYDNVTLLVGNHEDKLYKYACDDEFKMDLDIKNTIKEFQENKIEKSEIRGFIKKLSQIAYIELGENTYILTHGGIPYIPELPFDFYSTSSFIYGIDKYNVNIDKIYNDFMAKAENKIYQIHGHRNPDKIKCDEYKYSINLEGNVENGGYLRVLNIDKNGKFNFTEIKNEIYNHNLIEETNVYNLIENLKKNKYVIEKDLGNDISSFNFSKEAFYNKVWDNITTKARGLFIDSRENRILARSYNKFFKIGERKETSLENIEKNLKYPVNFYLKYNGFLGLVSVKDKELFFASKSTNNGEHVEYFKKIFYQQFNNRQIEAIKNKIITENVTCLFEVIDNTNDPHIIEYKESKIVLLDMIYNKTDYSKASYDALQAFALQNDIEAKELVYTANDLNSFKKIYEIISAEDYKFNNEYVEGFVLEDSNDFMVKTKSFYYDKWKYLRYRMEETLKNNNYKLKSKDELENSFMEFLKLKYANKEVDFKKINIIDERNEFEKNKHIHNNSGNN